MAIFFVHNNMFIQEEKMIKKHLKRYLPQFKSREQSPPFLRSSKEPTGPEGPKKLKGKQRIPGLKGEQGPPGKGLSDDYAHICGINWIHGNKTSSIAALELNDRTFSYIVETLDLDDRGSVPDHTCTLLIAFDQFVHSGHIHSQSIRVFVKQRPKDDQRRTDCWCELTPGIIQGVTFSSDNYCEDLNTASEFMLASNQNGVANGALFIPFLSFEKGKEYRVVINGDFIARYEERGKIGPAVDADHLPPWLPKRRKTGDGVEGGTFESWFSI
jgi:hypothetical protein